jgi:hypothetical protein
MLIKGRRTIVPLSLSPANPDALIVAAALSDVGERGRSAAILRWAAAYLSGQAREVESPASALGITEDELDALLDAF